jgi:hypothetical protein
MSDRSANDLVSEPEDRTQTDEAVVFLRRVLADGPMPSAELLKLARQEGFSAGTLHRAKQRIGVVSEKPGMTEPWECALPETAAAA